MMLLLDQLDSDLFDLVTQNLSSEKVAFVRSKWNIIRDYGCRNSGFKKWGKHLLKLTSSQKKHVYDQFRDIVSAIEIEGIKIWKDIAPDPHIESMVRLFFDDRFSMDKVALTLEEKVAFFWKYNPSLIKQFRDRFEQIFRDCFEQRIWEQHHHTVVEMFIGHLIALYPYLDPSDQVELLQFSQESWQLIPYRVERIPLIMGKMVAYGLIPKHSQNVPLLLFQGTPYPSASGFWNALMSDLHPFRSIGEDIFLKAKPFIEEWMRGKEGVKCYGLSLGGALGYHFGSFYGERVFVHAYVSPGLFPYNFRGKLLHGVGYYHIGDLINAIGYHPDGDNFKCYVLITDAYRNFFFAHAKPAGCSPTLMIEINSRYENRRGVRHLVTGIKQGFCSFFFFFLFILKLMQLAQKLSALLYQKISKK